MNTTTNYTKNISIDYETGAVEKHVTGQALFEDSKGYYVKVLKGNIRVQPNVTYLMSTYKATCNDDKAIVKATTAIGRFCALIRFVNSAGIVCTASGNNKRYASDKDIADLIGVKERAAKIQIKEFISLGWISRINNAVEDGKAIKTLYAVNFPAVEINKTGTKLYLDDYARNRKEIINSGLIDKSVTMIENFYNLKNKAVIKEQAELVQEQSESLMDIFNAYVLRGGVNHPYFNNEGGKFKAGYSEENCFYLVNESENGNRTEKDITAYTNLYLDIDCGRNEAGDYLTLEQVRERKEEIRLAILLCMPEPTAIVDTRNGYHVLYSIHATKDKEAYKEAQRQLVNAFYIADNLTDTSRVLRMPGTVWNKDASKYEPYTCELVQASPVRYEMADLLQELESKKEGLHNVLASIVEDYGMNTVHATKKATVKKEGITYSSEKQKARIDAFKNKELVQELAGAGDVAMNDVEFKNFVKRQNMRQLFCMPSHGQVHCLMHNDKHPSAIVLQTDAGIDKLVCKSTNCVASEHASDNIDILMNLTGLSYGACMDYARELFNIPR